MLEQHEQDFLLAEYQTLRQEMLQRTRIQHQLISIALIALGTFVSLSVGKMPWKIEGAEGRIVGVQTMMLTYPILAACLAAFWSQNDIRIAQIGAYIRNEVENQFTVLGWERFLYRKGLGWPVRRRALFAASGIFVVTQVLTLFLYYFKFEPVLASTGDIVLFSFDILVIVVTAYLFVDTHTRSSLIKDA